METNQTDSVNQTETSSANSENEKQVSTKSDDTNRYKRDMFKYKDEVKAFREKLNGIELADEQRKGNFALAPPGGGPIY